MFALCIESSHTRGMGHLYRSLNLAEALKKRGHQIQYVINDDSVSISILKQKGYEPCVVDLTTTGWEAGILGQTPIRLWINDRLDTSKAHAKLISVPLVTFDDRGEGAALADLHIAALAFDQAETLKGKQVLRGADYLILNPEIAKYQRVRHNNRPVLITLGGSDTWGATVKVVRILAERGRDGTVVVGPGFQHHEELAQVMTDSFVLKRGVPSMIEEISRYELAITGGGITPFEANAAGLPCIVVANETFEIPVALGLEALGGAVFAGHHGSLDVSVFDRDLPIEHMSRNAMTHVGLEGTRRVVDVIEALI